MRHAQQSTTDDVYGGPSMEEQRKANTAAWYEGR